MSLKKFDLAKNLALKLDGQMKRAGTPDRFAQGTGAIDKREQRRLDTAAGLVPFACKLPMALVKRLNERAASHEGGLNVLLAQLLDKGLNGAAPDGVEDQALAKAPAKKTAAKKAASKSPD
jgi:hypothetical protein